MAHTDNAVLWLVGSEFRWHGLVQLAWTSVISSWHVKTRLSPVLVQLIKKVVKELKKARVYGYMILLPNM